MARPTDTGSPRDEAVRVRLDARETLALDSQRVERGGMSRSAYVRHLIQQDGAKLAREKGSLR